jgi:hypothetical protein
MMDDACWQICTALLLVVSTKGEPYGTASCVNEMSDKCQSGQKSDVFLSI